jgi:hypothetical protein
MTSTGFTASVTVTGQSDDLIAWLWGRTPGSQLAYTGDAARIDAWSLSAHI